jgi:hypothetical protein
MHFSSSPSASGACRSDRPRSVATRISGATPEFRPDLHPARENFRSSPSAFRHSSLVNRRSPCLNELVELGIRHACHAADFVPRISPASGTRHTSLPLIFLHPFDFLKSAPHAVRLRHLPARHSLGEGGSPVTRHFPFQLFTVRSRCVRDQIARSAATRIPEAAPAIRPDTRRQISTIWT